MTIASVWANRSAILWDLGKYQEAIASANSAIKIDPDSIAAWFNRGLSFNSINDDEEAVNSYQKSRQLYPQQVEILVAGGTAKYLYSHWC